MFRFGTRKLLAEIGSFSGLMRCSLLFFLLLLVACETGIYHTVKSGQTLYRISRTYGVSETSLKQANKISDPTKVRVGTRLFIPGADRVRSVAVVTPAPAKKKPTTTAAPTKKTVAAATAATKKMPVAKKAPSKTRKTVRATSVKKLIWPLRGKLVRSFSNKAKAGSGKGIEIAVRSGSTVSAAEAGKVIYSGDGVNGYGHLIILQHENDLFTVYGFNQRNYARQGDFVSKGEKIALSGTPPAGGTPRLHFEVRKGKQAVNPILYLP